MDTRQSSFARAEECTPRLSQRVCDAEESLRQADLIREELVSLKVVMKSIIRLYSVDSCVIRRGNMCVRICGFSVHAALHAIGDLCHSLQYLISGTKSDSMEGERFADENAYVSL